MTEKNEYKNKINILNKIKIDCNEQSKMYKKRYKRFKKIDDSIDFVNAIISGSSIVLIVVGFSVPPCLIASAILSGINFIVSRGQDKYNFKSKYIQYNTTFQQYDNLQREIIAIMSKNNLSSNEYQKYIEELNDKIGLILDTQLI